MNRAKQKSILKNLKSVDTNVLHMFEESAKLLIKDNGGDAEKALQIALAYAAGHYETKVPTKSLLTKKDGASTCKMFVEQGKTLDQATAFGHIQKYWNPRIADSVKTMRSLRDGTGVLFDIRSDWAESFMENYEHLKNNDKRIDFEMCWC